MKKLLRKAAELKGILPSSFYLQNVKRTGTSPFAGGGFSDVWMGEMDETQVVLKALRFFEARWLIRLLIGSTIIVRVLRRDFLVSSFSFLAGLTFEFTDCLESGDGADTSSVEGPFPATGVRIVPVGVTLVSDGCLALLPLVTAEVSASEDVPQNLLTILSTDIPFLCLPFAEIPELTELGALPLA